MNIELRLGVIFLMCILMSACAGGPLKAPCDSHASFCGAKTKINQW